MLSAFKAQPIVELKQRDKSKIESILAHSDQLLVGLNTGSLRVYRTPSSSDANTELLQEYEKFSKHKIDQLAVFREANILVSLSNGLVSIYSLGTYTLQEQLPLKGATVFAATSNIVKDATSGVPTLVSRLAVAVKRRLILWSWLDGELAEEVVEIALPNSIKSLTWSTGTKIVAGLNTNYVMVDIDSQEVVPIIGPGSIGGADQNESRLGGTMTYIGMGAMIPTPLATGLDKEILLAKDINTHFIDRDGNPIGRRQVPWSTAPQAVGYSYPFLLALQDPTKGALEVRNPQTLTLLQLINLPGATLLQVPNPNISLAHQGKGFLVASERVIWRMQGLNYDAQIDALVESGSLDEAISLLDMIEDTLIQDAPKRLREIKLLKAQRLFDNKQFREGLDLFGEVAAPPETVIKLYPEVISGELADQIPQSPLKKGHKKSASLASNVSSKKRQADVASVRSLERQGLSETDLKPAVRELQSFLAEVRRRLQRFFNPDQTPRDQAEVEDSDQLLAKHLLGLASLDDSIGSERLIETARLVDTTLFRVYMYATPSLAGSLFRIPNFCDPEVVMTKLEQKERYNDLIHFLYGKRLHRQALERLQRFGHSKIDPDLSGPSRTISYLQNLPPELIDLILEFAQWPMETAPNLGMEIFIADTENAESLPRDKISEFLEALDKHLAQRYLEHIIDEWGDMTPSLHQKLLDLYLEKPDPKLVPFLQTSTQYSPAKVLEALPRDNPAFYEARAIVFSKMGNHKQALEIYVFKLEDPARAEEYCNLQYRKSDDEPSIYHILLSLYLNPKKPLLKPAIELMAKHGSRLPANSTLDLIPPELLVRELEFYFRGRMRHANSVMNDSKIISGLQKVNTLRVQAALLGDGGRSRRVRVDEERVCGVCHKRLGGSVISVFPDNSVVHLGCANRRQAELD